MCTRGVLGKGNLSRKRGWLVESRDIRERELGGELELKISLSWGCPSCGWGLPRSLSGIAAF